MHCADCAPRRVVLAALCQVAEGLPRAPAGARPWPGVGGEEQLRALWRGRVPACAGGAPTLPSPARAHRGIGSSPNLRGSEACENAVRGAKYAPCNRDVPAAASAARARRGAYAGRARRRVELALPALPERCRPPFSAQTRPRADALTTQVRERLVAELSRSPSRLAKHELHRRASRRPPAAATLAASGPCSRISLLLGGDLARALGRRLELRALTACRSPHSVSASAVAQRRRRWTHAALYASRRPLRRTAEIGGHAALARSRARCSGGGRPPAPTRPAAEMVPRSARSDNRRRRCRADASRAPSRAPSSAVADLALRRP